MDGNENKLVYNGVDLRTLGLYVSGNRTFGSPTKEYEKISIPGRSGDLFLFNNRYSNVNLEYDCIVIPLPGVGTDSAKFRSQIQSIKEALFAPNGYAVLTDCYHPDEYRLGVFEGPFEIDAMMLSAGETTLNFNCRPERWAVTTVSWAQKASSDISVSLSQSAVKYPARPLIGLVGDYLFTVSFYNSSDTSSSNMYSQFTIQGRENGTSPVYIDCESMDVYYSTSTSSSDKTALTSGFSITKGTDFPIVKPGSYVVISHESGANAWQLYFDDRRYTL